MKAYFECVPVAGIDGNAVFLKELLELTLRIIKLIQQFRNLLKSIGTEETINFWNFLGKLTPLALGNPPAGNHIFTTPFLL